MYLPFAGTTWMAQMLVQRRLTQAAHCFLYHACNALFLDERKQINGNTDAKCT